MEALLANVSALDIFAGMVAVAVIIFFIADKYGDAKTAKREWVEEEHIRQQVIEELPHMKEMLEDHDDKIKHLITIADTRQEETAEIKNDIQILLKSDRSRIKGELLKEYMRFKEQGYIDSYSLDYLHQQYDIYKLEEGNSWGDEMIEKIDELEVKDN